VKRSGQCSYRIKFDHSQILIIGYYSQRHEMDFAKLATSYVTRAKTETIKNTTECDVLIIGPSDIFNGSDGMHI